MSPSRAPSAQKRRRARPAQETLFRPLLRAGDAVIHLDHGMGKLIGLSEGFEADGPERIAIEYADGTRLMVSADEMDRVWRYGSQPEAVTLDKSDSGAWQKRARQASIDVAEAAVALTEAARRRRETQSPIITFDAAAYNSFCATFRYHLTRDQSAATEASLEDMTRGYPMDRLVCGDVGFGKTEVALRAAAAVALSGRQVAIIAPTTVLARQHALTFERRFAKLGIKTAHLSRLTCSKDVAAMKEAIASGEALVVVGTHALLSKTVRFADLALLVIDEEQRFGAAHKTGLRRLGEGVHTLAMTATPIPRTLQSAMIGLRDVSVLKTPPRARRPVKTRVAEWNDVEIAAAISAEVERGGQAFVVCPRLSDIEAMQERLHRLAPDLAIHTAHGKLKADDLDAVMTRFADGDGDVLLATNIIESGLNVPRANTLIVWRAEMFGLGQLHQLRGRVGRSDIEAHAILTYEDEKALTRTGRERLEALREKQSLGAGFEISALDLDQRGAGSVTRDDQAGHVTVLGSNLYAHLLNLALNGSDVASDDALWSPELKLGLKPRLPDDYVPDAADRLALYARIARVLDFDELRAIRAEIEETYGTPPPPVLILTERARLRLLCRKLDVARASAGPKGVALDLRPAALSAAQALAEADDLTLEDDRLVLSIPLETQAERLRAARDLLKRLDKAAA
ncbi:MAG: DEAD/DEAH box helicase [Pseudomonadota bacterium]